MVNKIEDRQLRVILILLEILRTKLSVTEYEGLVADIIGELIDYE